MWTFMGHWEDDRIVIDYVVPGAVEDTRIDTGQYDQGLWAASGTGATIEDAQRDARSEYETHRQDCLSTSAPEPHPVGTPSATVDPQH